MLQGNLDVFPLPEVLRFVAGSGVTGRVEIVRDEVGGEVSIDRGRFVAARLGEDEPPSTVDEALDVAVLLFDGSGGTFVVVQEEWVGGPLDLDADQLTAAVERRRQEWASVVQVLGSLEDPLSLVPELPDGVDQVTINGDQWRLLALVDGKRSVQDIARDSASSVYTSGVTLAELANAGMVARGGGVWVEPEPQAAPSPKKRQKAGPAADPDAAEMLRELVEEGEDDGASTDERDEPKASQATVRPLRAPTREEQRLRLRR